MLQHWRLSRGSRSCQQKTTGRGVPSRDRSHLASSVVFRRTTLLDEQHLLISRQRPEIVGDHAF